MRNLKVAVTGVALFSLMVPAVAQGGALSAQEPAKRAFTQCGDYPADFTYGLRVENVSCSRGKQVSERYDRKAANNGFPNVVRFGSWRCTHRDYYDGQHVKCKDGSKQVRFSMGG